MEHFLFYSNVKQLQSLKGLLANTSDDEYARPHIILSNATIGQHVRHIIEMYNCVLDNYNEGVVNYDKRLRNLVLETSVAEASNALEIIAKSMAKPNRNMMLQVPNTEASGFLDLDTNYYRELQYNLEHGIHHMALIRIGVAQLSTEINLPENFGVADSTMTYRQANK
jgi:hypothetical protein